MKLVRADVSAVSAAGTHVMTPGDTVTIPAGHPHRHGAVPGKAFSHLAIASPGDEITIVDRDARGAWGALPGGKPA